MIECKVHSIIVDFLVPNHSTTLLECMAGTTGLEPATSAVTGQRSNQLSYVPKIVSQQLGYMFYKINDLRRLRYYPTA